jgi:hypothetical protein
MEHVLLRFFERALIVAVAGMCIFLGYKLFLKGISGEASLIVETGKFKFQLVNAAPGIFLALFGAAIVTYSLYSGLKIDKTMESVEKAQTAQEINNSHRPQKESNLQTSDMKKVIRKSQKIVYGSDDHQDVYQVTDPDIYKYADSVAGLINMARIKDNGDGTSTILTVLFANSHLLCEGERFRNQPTAPHCSGFLVASDIIATAGHCINQNNLVQTRFVFGFQMVNESEARNVIDNDNIFRGIEILTREESTTGADYALVQLDRPAIGRPILKIRRTGQIDENQSVYVMGHPSGLPLKYAPGANVRDNSNSSYFVANLNIYGGNPGSPVFNTNNGKVEGILARGDTDFVRAGNCYKSTLAPTTGARGQEITRTTEFAELVPEIIKP